MKPTSPLKKAFHSLQKTGRTLKQSLQPPAAARRALSTVKARRVARRKPSGLQLVLADRVDFLNPAHWDPLVGDRVFMSRNYLGVLALHAPDNVTTRYALAYEESDEDGSLRPVAAMVFQRLTLTGDRLRKPSTRAIHKPAARLKEQLLVAGNVLVCGPRSLAVAPGADMGLVWQGLGEALYRLRRADRLLGETNMIMVKDFAGDTAEARDALRLLGYRGLETEPDMVLTLRPHWRSYDDYLADMTSSYRSAARKLDKDCAAAGVSLRCVSAQEMQQRQDELQALYLQVHEAQGLRLATLTPGYLPAMATALGERFVCRVAEQAGRWLGFLTSVHDDDTTIAYFVGFDRVANETAPIYLTLLQHAVKDAIGFGTPRLSMGRTALEPKAKMGCLPEPLACAVRHRVSAMNAVVGALVRATSHDEPPERSPFKKGAGPTS